MKQKKRGKIALFLALLVIVLLLLPVHMMILSTFPAVYYVINDYVNDLVQPKPDLVMLHEVTEIVGLMPIFITKGDQSFHFGNVFSETLDQNTLVGQQVEMPFSPSSPKYIADKLDSLHFDLSYKPIDTATVRLMTTNYFAQKPLVVRKMIRSQYPTADFAVGQIYVLKQKNGTLLFAFELSTQAENDLFTHELLIFKQNKQLFNFHRTIFSP